MSGPHLLLINPWIYDFAAYDLWAKPLGLLYLAAILRANGFSVDVLDCLTAAPGTEFGLPPARGEFGTGKFLRRPIPKPFGLKDVPKTFSRYGIELRQFQDSVKKLNRPQAVLVTSLMTYWYPGAFEVIRHVKDILPDVPVILGGIYATLCSDHAHSYSQADYVLPGLGEKRLPLLLSELTGHELTCVPDAKTLRDHPYPAFDLLGALNYVCILTSRGCPFRCAYCASHRLTPFFEQRDPDAVVKEILYWRNQRRVRDFVFYDDALLVNKTRHIRPILEEIISQRLDIRFHTPNALHIREIDDDTAGILFRAGFKTVRLGFETADMTRHRKMDGKFHEGDFVRAVSALRRAGFEPKDIGVYVLAGLPGQTWEEVLSSVAHVEEAGAAPYLAEYSPIPSSPLWPKALQTARYPIAEDPIYQNNSLFPCAQDFPWETIQGIKTRVHRARSQTR